MAMYLIANGYAENQFINIYRNKNVNLGFSWKAWNCKNEM
jgi:hypothetical protein